MKTVGVRELKSKATEYLRLARTEGPIIITNHGKPQAAIVAIDPDELEDFLLLHSPKIKAAIQRGIHDANEGRVYPLEKLVAETEDEYK